jgi:hypothetical protein
MFSIFLFCSALFVLYDVLVQRQSGRHAAVLDTKRRFVRFISHEIRTPLNTVRLGMKLLEVEIANLVKLLPITAAADLALMVSQTLASWKQLADEIIESSESAVEVLDDLLNYDKIEIGTMKLEFGTFSVLEVVERYVATMHVQAQQKDIKIQLSCRATTPVADAADVVPQPAMEDGAAREAVVIGDVVRIRQVLRSLIANALKFTPDGGLVEVTGTANMSRLMSPSFIIPHVIPFLCSGNDASVRSSAGDCSRGIFAVHVHGTDRHRAHLGEGLGRRAVSAAAGGDLREGRAVQCERAAGRAGQRPGPVHQQGHRGAARREAVDRERGPGQGGTVHR